MKTDRPIFSTESALCASFAEAAQAQGWVVYPETDGWDLLAVREGLQIGVQAKLRPNMKVLAQCVDWLKWWPRGPHYIAVLVPHRDQDFEKLAGALGIAVLHPVRSQRSPRWAPLQRDDAGGYLIHWPHILDYVEHHRPMHFDEPAWTPPIMPDVPAGVPAPVRLTAWKVQALRLIARLELRGYVTRRDFQDIGLSPSSWYHRWVEPAPLGYEGPPRWVRCAGVRLADAQHPEAYKTLLEQERQNVGPVAVSRPQPPPAEQPALFAEIGES